MGLLIDGGRQHWSYRGVERELQELFQALDFTRTAVDYAFVVSLLGVERCMHRDGASIRLTLRFRCSLMDHRILGDCRRSILTQETPQNMG